LRGPQCQKAPLAQTGGADGIESIPIGDASRYDSGMKRLEGKVAVVTGGARGIGAATARRFRSEGARVVVWDLVEPSSAERDGLDGVRHSALDVTDAAAVEHAVKEVIAREGKMDILVNNAGIIHDAFASAMTLEAWDGVLRVNLTGTFLPCRAVIPHFRERKSGRIINTSSTSAFGNRGQANYAASKAGVIGLTRTLALELARDGVTVNGVAPGTIATDMLAKVPEKVLEKFLARIPLGRFGKPEDVAAVHAFLASEDAAFITGQIIVCDGGLTLGG
jgi:3-oxoacyl-[acyl-carrier protein] reductase